MNNNKKSHNLSPLSGIVEDLSKKLLGKKGLVEIDIILNWNKIIGQELSSFTFPQKISFSNKKRSDGCLYITVISGALALELKYKEKIIIEKINSYFGYNAISKLAFEQNPSFFNTLKENNINSFEERKQKPLVTKEEESYIEEITKDLENEKLKEILTKLGYEIISLNKRKDDST